MKKLLALLLAGIMIFSLAACGEEAANDTKEAETKTEEKADAQENEKDVSVNPSADEEKVTTEEAEKVEKVEETEKSEKDADENAAVVGDWTAVEFDSEEFEDLSDEELAMVEEMLSAITLSFDADGTGVLSMDGEDEAFEWADNGDTISMTKDGDTIEAKLSDGKLVMEDEGMTIVFKKTIYA